jgi:two-component system, LuxR family, response regulator FixJ
MSTAALPTVCIVDDDDAVRDSLAFLFKSVRLRSLAFNSAGALLAALPIAAPACAVVDVRMPGMSGLELLEALQAKRVALPVIIMTGHGDVPMAVRAMKAGALDFLEKPFNDQALIEAVQRALGACAPRPQGEIARHYATLTPREREVMALIVEGRANKVVGAELGMSVRTVEVHRARIMEKMGVRSLAELVRAALSMDGARG